jgi:D-3-phosphoglycerate dehydrogenase / 2-oxoglutarate reductase
MRSAPLTGGRARPIAMPSNGQHGTGAIMSANIKRVGRLDLWLDPAFNERLRAEPDIELRIAAHKGPEADVWDVLSRAHVYQVSAAINELPKPYQVRAALLQRCPELLCVSAGGAGLDTVDIEACTRAGVAVVNQSGANAQSVAELAFGLMLAVARKIPESDRLLRTERGFSRERLMGTEIGGATLGLIGIGNTGSRSAAIARGFGMRVLAFDPLLGADEVSRRGAEKVELAELLAASDLISVHCPLDRTTAHMIAADAFAAMKPGCIFVTTARGGIHDEAALYAALTSGHLGGAGLDVWDVEPPPLDLPLLTLPNVVATFHTAGVTARARRNVATWAADQIVQILQGEQPPRLVNPEVWPAFLARYGRVFG